MVFVATVGTAIGVPDAERPGMRDRYSSLRVVKQAMEKGPGFRRHVPALLFFIALALMFLSVSRPAAVITLPSQRGTAVGSGILSSPGTPIEFTPTNRGTPLGRIEEIEAPEIGPMPPGTYRSAVVILITDGQTTQGPDPLQAAQLAADLGVRIFTVGLGTPEGVVLAFGGRSFRVILDEETLMEIADITDGEYFRASSETDLRQIYQSLSTQLLLETEETEITALIAGLASLLMLVGATLSLLWFGRVL